MYMQTSRAFTKLVTISTATLHACIKCDRACKNQPRSRTKITKLFEICLIIIYALFILANYKFYHK